MQMTTETVRMSNRQLCLLEHVKRSPNKIIRIDKLSGFNQLTVGGCRRREFILETPIGDGIMLTEKGEKAIQDFRHADFYRRVSSMHFSSFLHLNSGEERDDRRRRPARSEQSQSVRQMRA